MHSLG